MINEQQNIASRSKNNILIIEDDLSLSDNLEIFLTKKKFNVLISHTGKDALKICLQQPPDLIICDIMLPDMNGYSIIKTIKMNEPTKSVPFIFLSALADGSDVQKGLDLGAQTYLTKPLKVNKLLEIIYSSIDTSNEEKQTILIIEDDTDMRDNLNSIFSKNGYKVVSAQNGQEGLEKALNFKPNLVVCDVMLPDIDGYSVLEELMRSETRAVPFIYLSAKSELSDVRRGMSLGADDFITKPFKTDDLLNSVKMRIHKQKIIKRHYKSSNSIPDKSDVIKKVNKAEEDAKLITRKKDIENLFSHSSKKI
ncbi:MAG: response regulator, partial [Ignavibacteriaceae bacterium]|nr:response regulator [Ignavibacteriaceae bacterium]